MKTQIKTMLVMFALVMLMTGISSAQEFEITDVIEVGPATLAPSSPVMWSLDGTKIAYFNGRTLMISDTLGKATEIKTFDLSAHRFEWLSDNEIIIRLIQWGTMPRPLKMVIVDILTGNITVLGQFNHGIGIREKNVPYSFSSPLRSLEGNVYYRKNILHANVPGEKAEDKIEPIVFPESKYEKDRNIIPSENHYLSWNDNGLNKISCDLLDTTLILNKKLSSVAVSTTLSYDEKYVIKDGYLYSFEDSQIINISLLIDYLPVNMVNAHAYHETFNPIYPEILFDACYQDAQENGTKRIGIYDINSNGVEIIGEQYGLIECWHPVYSPNGNNIASVCDKKLYIICREKL